MTPENQRLALAKWGFKQTYHECTCPEDCGRMIPDPSPDYLNDLNAVAELEAKLPGMQDEPWKQYVVFLGGLIYESLPPHLRTAWHDSEEFPDWLLITATAVQRCEALLRTIGLWEE